MKPLMCRIFGCKTVVVERYPLGYNPQKRYVYFKNCVRCGGTVNED